MKRKIPILLTAAFLTASFCTGMLCGAVSVPSNVGLFTDDKTKVLSGFDAAAVGKVVKAEYVKISGLKTESGNGTYNFGKSSAENVHKWAGSSMETMVQDFEGGSSTTSSINAFGHGDGWSVIVVNPQDHTKAFTVRDSVLNLWGAAGGANSTFGWPTSEQYWDGTTLYQNFSNGYCKLPQGSSDLGTFVVHAQRADTGVYENPKFTGGAKTSTPAKQSTPASGAGKTGSTAASGGQSAAASSTASLSASENSAQSSVLDSSASDAASAAGVVSSDASGTVTTVTTLNVGATVGLVAGVIVVVLGGGFALYWFVLRKKLKVH